MVTFQKWEGTVLQLHDNAFQDGQHGRDVQQDQDDGLRGERSEHVTTASSHEGWYNKTAPTGSTTEDGICSIRNSAESEPFKCFCYNQNKT